MARKLLLLVLILTLVQKGYPLRCYTCESPKVEHSDCVRPSKDKVISTECRDGVCAFYKTKHAATGITTITRSCAPKDICLTLKLQEAHYGKLKKCETCKTDFCNSGNIHGLGVATLGFYLFLFLCVL